VNRSRTIGITAHISTEASGEGQNMGFSSLLLPHNCLFGDGRSTMRIKI
jgi:hypothetical protein